MAIESDILKVGKAVPRADALDKVTGKVKYATDYYGRELVWAGVKRAGVPHARLKDINIESARSLPCVMAVLTYKDIRAQTGRELSERTNRSWQTTR